MGKYKKSFPKKEAKDNPKENSFKERAEKNAKDLNENSHSSTHSTFQNKQIKPNIEYVRTHEKSNNKFDIQYPEANYKQIDFSSRKESKDSTNDSISYDDYFENDYNHINLSNNYSNNKSINKFSQQTKQKGKKQGPFKSTASDFKIKYKTELCKYFEINGFCKYGDKCAYAHGKENLRSKVTNSTAYRTKKCVQFFENGYCPYGNRCQFAHQLTSNIINNPYDRKMTYKKTLETISKLENVENIKKLIEKPRLSVFKEIIENKNLIKSTLLDDIKEINQANIIERNDDS
jgi:hypothetical protein